MKKQTLLAVLRQSFPQYSKDQLYAKILCGEVCTENQTLRNPKQSIPKETKLRLLTARRYVSRGGEKLHKAIEEFDFFETLWPNLTDDKSKIIGLDAGASSGGFTDCLLQHGCSTVYAVDSGKNQLDFKLRCDPRVRSFEGIKIQDFLSNLPNLGLELPDFAVMDISFRSILVLIVPTLLLCRKRSGIFLCKPQFEWSGYCQAHPEYLDLEFNGIVKDELAQQVFRWFCQQLELNQIEILGSCLSPIRGGQTNNKGNLEYLLYLRLSYIV